MSRILLSFTLILFAALAAAQDVEVKIKAPNKVKAGEPFRISVSVNAQNARLSDPQLNDFQCYGRSTSSSMQMINGDITVERAFIYTLVAEKEGTFTINPVTAEVGGKSYKSNSVTITVEKGESNVAQNSQQQMYEPQNNSDAPAPTNSGDLFVDVVTNKSDVYVGEQIILSSYLYSRYDIRDFEDAKFPKFSGFWAKDISNPKNITFDRKRVNNQVYLYAPWQKKALFPQKAGTLEIDPYTINCIVRDSWGFRTARLVATSKVKQIKVKPLPEGKPANFGGAVGNFTISMSSDKKEVKLDEPLTVKVTVNGGGNFQLFEAPKVQFPSAFEQFEPKSSENINAGANGITGSKTFSTVVIARQPGEYTIPPVEFSYFDPSSKSYKTVSTKELVLTISGERDSNSVAYSTVPKSDIVDLGSDIRFIKQDGVKLKNGKSQFFNSFEFWIIISLLILAFAAVIVLRMQQIKNNANVIGMKNRRAGKTSRKRLKQAANFMNLNKKDDFYVEILNALWGYLSDKLAIPVAKLSRDNVSEKLTEKGIEQPVIQKFMDVLDTCEFEHYAPESMSHPLDEVYTMAAEAIETMESSIKA